ncbi:MAG TPA: methyltransferase domain-containing protein [Stellaceae bacterium]|nr:methyltransferase domain-containing protein [Stellaceae bacterium]
MANGGMTAAWQIRTRATFADAPARYDRSAMASSWNKLRYDTTQAARVAWFFGQKLLAARFTRPVEAPPELRGREVPDRARILGDLRKLLEQDWRNIAAGHYLPPEDWPRDPLGEIARAIDCFADMAAVDARRHGDPRERLLDAPEAARYPAYYRQRFHFQSDGYLSAASAARYDHQVEILFGGAAAAMRRQALVPLRAALLESPLGARAARLVDIGCGTGAFLAEVKRNYPRLAVIGIDLSAPYLAVARKRLAAWSRATLAAANGEALPLADASVDIVTSIYLLHELPPAARRTVAGEIRRVLKPGGRFINVDSLQAGDTPDYDAMLEWFPVAFHEPYYASYLREDLGRLLAPGFAPVSREVAYFSTVASWRRTDG